MKYLIGALMASFFMPAHAVTFLDPVMDIPEEITIPAAEDHDILVLALVKDCEIYGLNFKALKDKPEVRQVNALLVIRGYPQISPIAAIKYMEKHFNVKIVIRQQILKAGESFCQWAELKDQWYNDSPYSPVKKHISA